MDNIIKKLGDLYIGLFQSRLAEIFEPSFMEGGREMKKALIKLFRIWEYYFPPRVLSPIALRLNL
jgi:hypothetical protein